MTQYEDDADALAEHVYPCDDPYCQICDEEDELEDGMGWDGDESK